MTALEKIRVTMMSRIKELGMKKLQVSEAAGYSKSTLCGFLNGTYGLKIDTLIDHLEAIDMDLVAVPKDKLNKSILKEVQEERDRQDEKWGAVRNHHPLEWLCILGEEVGEVNKAVCEAHWKYENGETWQDYRQELIQVAAVAIAMIESFDIHGEPKSH